MPLPRAPRIAIIAGEASGDQLGAMLIRALKQRFPGLELCGVGGEAMAREGLTSLFPQTDIAVMGLGPVIRRLPLILRRMGETVRHVLDAAPDVLVTIDSPDFCKRVARRVRARRPDIRTIHWVCPSVWAWRPGRAPAMRPYIDHILCLLPFEPEALHRLKGPPGTYVGHPLVQRIDEFRPAAVDLAARENTGCPLVLVLPGSRLSVVRRMLPLFLAVTARLSASNAALRYSIPTLPHLVEPMRDMLGAEAHRFTFELGEAAKLAAFRQARAALAASGTVTLELALAGVPMVAAYRVAGWEAAIARRLISASSAILPNLILGENVVPEFIQEKASADNIHAAFAPILSGGPARERQREAFGRLESVMRDGSRAPIDRAVEVIAGMLQTDYIALQNTLGSGPETD